MYPCNVDVDVSCTTMGDVASLATTDSVANVPDDDDDDHHRRGDHRAYVMRCTARRRAEVRGRERASGLVLSIDSHRSLWLIYVPIQCVDADVSCTTTGDVALLATTDSVANVPDDDDDDVHHRRGDHSMYVMRCTARRRAEVRA